MHGPSLREEAAAGVLAPSPLLTAQQRVLDLMSAGRPLPEVLAALVRAVDELTGARSVLRVLPDDAGTPELVVTADGSGRLARDTSGAAREVPVLGPGGDELGLLLLEGYGEEADALHDEVLSWAASLATTAVIRAAEHGRMAASVALLAATLESTVDGILVVDAEGRFAGYNERFVEMWHIDPELAGSRDDARVMQSVLAQLRDPDGFVAGVQRLYGSPETTSFDEFDFLDGRVFERYSRPQRVDGEVVGRVWSFRDVTEKRRLQRDLDESRTLVTLLVEQVDDYAIINLDPAGAVVSWNVGAQRIFGHPAEEVLGRPVGLFHPEGEPADELLAAADRDGRAAVQGWRMRKDGSRFWADVVVTALRDADGRLRGFGKVTRDITDRREAELALQEHARVLELLGAAATASNAADDLADALESTLEAFVTYCHARVGSAYLTDPDHPGVLRHAAWYDEGDGDYSELHALTARVQGEELGLPGRIVWGDAQRQARLAEEPSTARIDAALRAGLTSTCAFPVMVRHEVVGVLELMSDGGREADLTLLQVMHHVGVQLGRVVERDRAERRLARHARQLERLTRQLDSVLNSAGEGICGLDAHGVVTFVNEAGAALLGATREELVGRPAVDVLPLEDEHGERTEPITDGERRLHTGTVQRADGTEFDCELVAARTRDDDETVGTVVVFRDVSERKAVDRLKDEFTSVMSHELRTPLTSVRGALGLLGGGATGELPSRAARMVEVATASTDRLIRLVNDILDVERMAAGRLTLHRGEHKATILVQTALAETAGLAADAGVMLIADPAPGTVWADPDRVVQVLTNLIGNAVKFSPGGAPVVVGSEVDGDVVRFHVRDDGPGIPDDQLDSIFERFRQADASDTRSRGGTGLGLTISRGLVRQHGGRIWAANRPGGGSTFSFELPREEHP